MTTHQSNAIIECSRMTARKIIEARLGHKLAPTRQLAQDEREAIKRLAIQLIKERSLNDDQD